MEKHDFIPILTETADNPQMIHGIFNWCDRWCERCRQTEFCTLYKTSALLPSDKPDDFFKSLSMIFEATLDMLKEQFSKMGIDFDSLKVSDITDDYDRRKYKIRKNEGLLLARHYGKQVKLWLDSLKEKEPLGLEIRLQDTMLTDCMEVIRWYHYMFEAKLTRALMSQKDEEDENTDAYDSVGIAKLLLVSINRNIGAWGYVYQKFPEDEDAVLDILVGLQKLNRQVESIFPNAKSFIRPGLD